MQKGCYVIKPDNATKSARANGSKLRVHFKNSRETAHSIKAMPLHPSPTCIQRMSSPTRRLSPSELHGRCWASSTGQCKSRMNVRLCLTILCFQVIITAECRWPLKSAEFLLHMLRATPSTSDWTPTIWSSSTFRWSSYFSGSVY